MPPDAPLIPAAATVAPESPRRGTMTPALLAIMSVATGAAAANIYYNQPLLGLIAASLHQHGAAAGLVAMATQIGYASGILLLVPLGDRVDRWRIILWQSVGLVLSMSAAALAPGLAALVVASVAIGVCASLAQQIVPFAADLSESSKVGVTVGTVMSGLLIGILVARTVSGLVAAAFGWRAMFWLGALLAAVIGAVLLRVLPHSRPASRESYPRLMLSMITLIRRHPTLRRASLVQACLFGVFSVFWSTLALRLQDPPFDMGAWVAGLFGLVGVVGAAAAPVAGRLSDRGGPMRTITVAILFVLAAMVEMLVVPGLTGLVIGVVLLDLGVQLAMVSNQTMVFALSVAARSRMNTVYVTGIFTGGAIGSGLAALAWRFGHWPEVAAVGIALSVLGLAIHLTGARRERGA